MPRTWLMGSMSKGQKPKICENARVKGSQLANKGRPNRKGTRHRNIQAITSIN